MNSLYDQVNLRALFLGKHQITFNKEDLGLVEISFILSTDGFWIKVRSCINGIFKQDVYLDICSGFIKDKIKN